MTVWTLSSEDLAEPDLEAQGSEAELDYKPYGILGHTSQESTTQERTAEDRTDQDNLTPVLIILGLVFGSVAAIVIGLVAGLIQIHC